MMKHTLDIRRVNTLLFDYGSTLIEFSNRQIAQLDEALAAHLEHRFGPTDRERLQMLRDTDRMAPYHHGYHEHQMPEISVNLIRNLYGRPPTQEELQEMLHVRFDVFLNCIRKPAGVGEILRRLHRKYRLGLVSNYPDGQAIRESLRRTELADCFDAVVVSGDRGVERVKPHPQPFKVALDQLGATPDTTVHVGDNWLADVQGAKRLGMRVIHCLQYQTPEKFDRQTGDHEPDLTIHHLAEIENHL